MPTFKYKCSNCDKKYLEHRDIEDPQFIFNCDLCGSPYIDNLE